jgi:hypothetical protein
MDGADVEVYSAPKTADNMSFCTMEGQLCKSNKVACTQKLNFCYVHVSNISKYCVYKDFVTSSC